MRALVVIVVVIAGCSSSRPPAPSATTVVASNAVVTHIDDGDTIDVRVGATTERVRLIGIDTPETKKPNTPIQCFGPEASAFTAAFLPIGTAVRLERDVEPRDPYHRLLAYVYRATDGAFVNMELARGGYARHLSIAPNTAHADELASAVDAARAAGRGLWGSCPAFGSPASAAPASAAQGTVAPGGR
jgi:micrococcal nuclease